MHLKKGKAVTVSFSYNNLLTGKVISLIKDIIEEGFVILLLLVLNLVMISITW